MLTRAKALADCDFVKEAITGQPGGIVKLIEGLQAGTNRKLTFAQEAAEEMGLTEGEAVKRGGGFLILAAALVAAGALAGCVKKGRQTRVGNEYTTPGKGISPTPPSGSEGADAGVDEGAGDGGTVDGR